MVPLKRLLRPESIAIIGASAREGALGRSVLDNLLRSGFSGRLYLVNPKQTEIQGRPCVPTIDDLPRGIDCAILAIPGSAVLAASRACGQRGFGGVIVFSAGFAETGAVGKAAQAELARIGDEFDMAIEGPNCLGIVNHVDVVPLTFVSSPVTPLGRTRRGIGIVSQSGAMAAVLSVELQARKLGLSFSISTGNEAHLGVEDFLEYLLDDPHTAMVAMLVEQFRRPQRFLELAGRARSAGVSIVLLHPGRGVAAQASAQTHTGAMAGDWQIMRTQVEREGVAVVETLEELVDVSDILMRCPQMKPGGAAILAESGAFKALALDYCERIDLPLPSFLPGTSDALRAVLPAFVTPTNPLDLTAQGLVERNLYRNALPPLLHDDGIACVVLTIIMTDAETSSIKMPPLLDAIAAVDAKKPIVFSALDGGADIPASYVDGLRDLGVPYFSSAERAFRAVARVGQLAKLAAREHLDAATPSLDLPRGIVPEYATKDVLARIGIPIGKRKLVTTVDDALVAAREIGFPVVLKAQAAALSHKSDAGGVVLNLGDERALRDGWANLHAQLAATRPGIDLDGVLVEAMAPRGIELIVGGRNDPDWGSVVLVGFGGVLAEAHEDVRLLPADLSNTAIVSELLSLKSAVLLRGFRGSAPISMDAVSDVVVKVGALMRAYPDISELEINPLAVYPEHVLALDALMDVKPMREVALQA
jgi:acyl-CoA synthetase (NDP forming)